MAKRKWSWDEAPESGLNGFDRFIDRAEKWGARRLTWIPGKFATVKVAVVLILAAAVVGILNWLGLSAPVTAKYLGIAALFAAMLAPRWLLGVVVKKHPAWLRWVVGGTAFVLLSLIIQEQSVPFVLLLIGIVGAGLFALAVRRKAPALALWVGTWALPMVVTLLMAPQLVLLRTIEFEVRSVDNVAEQVTTDFRAPSDAEPGETFNNRNVPLLAKYRSSDLQGLLETSRGSRVRAIVTGVRIPPWGIDRNLLWARPAKDAPFFPLGLAVVIGVNALITVGTSLLVLVIARKGAHELRRKAEPEKLRLVG